MNDRFWSKVVALANGCWEWNGHRDRLGYGRFMVERRPRLTHRLAFEELIGPIPDGLEPDHLCRNTSCLNPTHLELVTHAENIRRGYSHKPRPTHCPHGHLYAAQNTYDYGRGRRCKTCQMDQQRHYRAGKAA